MNHEESIARHPSSAATFVERMRQHYGITVVPDPEPSTEDKAFLAFVQRESQWWHDIEEES